MTNNNNNKKELPLIARRAIDFTKASMKQAIAGNPKRDKTEQKRIEDLCLACEFFIQDTKRCIKCGCYMKKKIPWQTTHCAIKKW